MKTRKLRVGEWVQVRTKEEILQTLDDKGQLDGMPFMPEMFRFCGMRFPVYKSAHKTCDYSAPEIRSRRLTETVHLDTRCNGEAHGGCEAACLLYWKHAWLKPLDESAAIAQSDSADILRAGVSGTAGRESDVWAATSIPGPTGASPTYACQATRIAYASADLKWWDPRPYIEDYLSGNVSLRRLGGGLVYATYYTVSQTGLGLGRPMRWLYNKMRWLWRGSLWPRSTGTIPKGQPTPAVALNLHPGELVRVKSHEQILQTVTTENLNRGMHWGPELVPYCGGTYPVLKLVTRIIDEKTGKMLEMKTPCVALDSVVCQGRYSFRRMLCPKSMYPYWREVWLERVDAGRRASQQDRAPVGASAHD